MEGDHEHTPIAISPSPVSAHSHDRAPSRSRGKTLHDESRKKFLWGAINKRAHAANKATAATGCKSKQVPCTNSMASMEAMRAELKAEMSSVPPPIQPQFCTAYRKLDAELKKIAQPTTSWHGESLQCVAMNCDAKSIAEDMGALPEDEDDLLPDFDFLVDEGMHLDSPFFTRRDTTQLHFPFFPAGGVQYATDTHPAIPREPAVFEGKGETPWHMRDGRTGLMAKWHALRCQAPSMAGRVLSLVWLSVATYGRVLSPARLRALQAALVGGLGC